MSGSLQRFIDAQEGMYDGVKTELGAGRKRGHWMWFVFPQVSGLGMSPTSQFFAIASIGEAMAYAAHPLLGARLRECAKLLLSVPGRSAEDNLGAVDAMKLHSSMTLFQAAVPDEPMFGEVLARYFDGGPDEATQRILAAWRSQA
ncbi:DUF1810 domain-containing protein [Arthrobacter sp. PAMC 25486]|uniref:DUF1810 domain-containing protein n=1 Tax=Arthrobacter sp. PAMC 25486 TaxID=1494608 RepID=UPI00056F313A|nr:DUF1810 domain-containing protein [Arthrobacter sp. PAMC 25486]